MTLLGRTLPALFAAALAVVLISTSADGGTDCVPKCKNAQASCDAACDQQKLVCINKCGGPPPLGSQKCVDSCASARTNCGNACKANEDVCEGKCLLPVK
jgi:hypothetical protein